MQLIVFINLSLPSLPHDTLLLSSDYRIFMHGVDFEKQYGLVIGRISVKRKDSSAGFFHPQVEQMPVFM
jgi:hypothetical protein